MTSYFTRAGIRGRLLIGLLISTLLLLGALVAYRTQPADDGPKPALGLMSTLPLQWSEGGIEADLSDDAQPHPVFVRLNAKYDVRPMDDLQNLRSKNLSLLLLAQPRALRPAELVALDAWVRNGGRVLILADPALQWGSLYPLGDKRRPLFTSLLSPLFTHWGLELVLPMTDEEPVVMRQVAAFKIRTQTLGEWLPKAGKDMRNCRVSPKGFVADCALGKGRAILVADADLLDPPYWEARGVRVLTGTDEFGNMNWVESLLVALRDDTAKTGEIVGK